MEKLGNNSKMTAKIALCPLWYTFAALRMVLVLRSHILNSDAPRLSKRS